MTIKIIIKKGSEYNMNKTMINKRLNFETLRDLLNDFNTPVRIMIHNNIDNLDYPMFEGYLMFGEDIEQVLEENLYVDYTINDNIIELHCHKLEPNKYALNRKYIENIVKLLDDNRTMDIFAIDMDTSTQYYINNDDDIFEICTEDLYVTKIVIDPISNSIHFDCKKRGDK